MSEEITEEDLLNMKLHEEKRVKDALTLCVRRVYGGWIYTNYIWDTERDIAVSVSQCFVPESTNVDVLGDITCHF